MQRLLLQLVLLPPIRKQMSSHGAFESVLTQNVTFLLRAQLKLIKVHAAVCCRLSVWSSAGRLMLAAHRSSAEVPDKHSEGELTM